MKKLIVAITIALPLFATNICAADLKPTEKKLTPQQSKMAACAKENKGLKGAEYKKARKECLSRDTSQAKEKAGDKEKNGSTKSAAPASDQAKPSQAQKMAACSKENKGLKGDEYKNAQKECLNK